MTTYIINRINRPFQVVLSPNMKKDFLQVTYLLSNCSIVFFADAKRIALFFSTNLCVAIFLIYDEGEPVKPQYKPMPTTLVLDCGG